MAYSSDEIIKREIIDCLGHEINGIKLRIFPQSSNADQQPFSEGGLTFGFKGVSYGSCDAAWYVDEKWVDGLNGKEIEQRPVIALEGTDALNRNSGGNALYQRFHHALGAVKNGVVGIYYLKKGKQRIQPDLFGMAYFASKVEKGKYLITDDLTVVKDLLERYRDPDAFNAYVDEYLEKMYEIFITKFNAAYGGDWKKFAERRSTIIQNGYVIKYAGRMRRNFTDGSQRAGHIATGEMFLTKYYFYDKKFYYLFPKMTHKDLEALDHSKATDKEWFLLRNEQNVEIKTMDDIEGLDSKCRADLLSIQDTPLKGDALRTFNKCMKTIVDGFKSGNLKLKIMISPYPKGSEWRKWDLHVHTPFTKLNNKYALTNGGDVWDTFCDKIEQSDVEVFGITDYFSIENYLEFKKKFQTKFPSSDKVFFPNVELRVDRSSNNRNEGYDLHLIFDNRLQDKDLQNFINNLKLENTDGNGKKIKANELKGDNDFKTAFTTIPLITEALTDTFGDKKPYLTVLMAHGHGGIQPEKNDSRKNAVAEETDKRVVDIYFGCDDKDREFFLNDRGEVKKKKPCISGSDAHSFKDFDDKVGKTFLNESRQTHPTWIKADMTFNGLRQIIHEPRERTSFSDKPDKLVDVEANSSRFIESIRVGHTDNKQTSGWFNDEIPLNSGLVAIIGRKGQGKSALADIIALCGRTKIATKDFSFLNKDKFRKKGLAKNYESVLTWVDKTSIKENLDADVNPTEVEKVKYLPQKYVETICNEDGVSDQFQREINKVIFSYIPDENRLGSTSLEDLISIKTSTIDGNLAKIKNDLHLTNEQVVKLENKLLPKYLETLTNKLKAKQQELASLVKPKVVSAPKKQPKKGDQDKLSKITTEIETISTKIETTKAVLKTVNEKILKLGKLRSAVDQLSQSSDALLKNFAEEAKLLSVDLSKLYTIKVNNKILDSVENKLVSKRDELDELLDQNTTSSSKSLFVKKLELEEKKKKLVTLLGEDQRKYSVYQDKLKEYNDHKKVIEGSSDDQTLETIASIEAEIKYLDKRIHEDLKDALSDRDTLASRLYSGLQQKSEFYKEIFKPLQKFIESEKKTQEKSGSILEFDAGIVFDKSSFPNKFLSFINQNRDGSFQYTDNGQKVLNKIIEKADFGNAAGIKAFTQELMDHLASDKTKTPEKQNAICSQLKGDNISFYDYVFGMDYLGVKYKVLFNGKDFNSNEFSPGEKGALLLIFYLLIDKDRGPLIMDQPEENLDNESIFELLVPYIRKAKMKRQVIIVTHNPNLAIVCDAEQIIAASMNKNKNQIRYAFGSIENHDINKKASDVLEGTLSAFDIRDEKYIRI